MRYDMYKPSESIVNLAPWFPVEGEGARRVWQRASHADVSSLHVTSYIWKKCAILP